MKVWKLVSGILSIVFSALVLFQSCAAGLANTLESNGSSSGTAGTLVAFLMLAGGIVSICVRKSKKNGGNVALVIMFSLAALIGISNVGIFKDLTVWSAWCAIIALLALICMFRKKKNTETVPETPAEEPAQVSES